MNAQSVIFPHKIVAQRNKKNFAFFRKNCAKAWEMETLLLPQDIELLFQILLRQKLQAANKSQNILYLLFFFAIVLQYEEFK